MFIYQIVLQSINRKLDPPNLLLSISSPEYRSANWSQTPTCSYKPWYNLIRFCFHCTNWVAGRQTSVPGRRWPEMNLYRIFQSAPFYVRYGVGVNHRCLFLKRPIVHHDSLIGSCGLAQLQQQMTCHPKLVVPFQFPFVSYYGKLSTVSKDIERVICIE